MSDHIDELCALVKAAGGTMRLYGNPVSAEELRGAVTARVDAKLRKLVTGLPTPSLTATITPPTCRAGLGAVKVLGFVPPPREPDPADERERLQKPRRQARCTLCNGIGHIASNRKHHPRPL
jgi:hypothetical protein